MADEDENNLTEDEYKVRRAINKQTKAEKQKLETITKCRPRCDLLAIPHKRAILDVYQNYAHHFSKDKLERIKRKLQELYAMTPEETEKYFEQLRKEANEIAKQKMMKIMMKKKYQRQEKEKEEERAYNFIEKIFKQGMMYSFNRPIPPLISVRLRNLSDIILEQICDLRNLGIPDRDNPDQIGLFLIAIADWIAVATEHVYSDIEFKKNFELADIEMHKPVQKTVQKDENKEDESKNIEDKNKKEVDENKKKGIPDTPEANLADMEKKLADIEKEMTDVEME